MHLMQLASRISDELESGNFVPSSERRRCLRDSGVCVGVLLMSKYGEPERRGS